MTTINPVQHTKPSTSLPPPNANTPSERARGEEQKSGSSLGRDRAPILPLASKLPPGFEAIAKILDAEKSMPIQKGSESRLLVHTDKPNKGLVVMLHGFSAGTWQFEDIAKKFYDRGYAVYLPRLPGHGLQKPDGKEDSSQLLNSKTWQNYHTASDAIYVQSRATQLPLYVMGLSGGGTMALDLATHHSDIKGGVIFAPSLNVGSFLNQSLFGAARSSESLGFPLLTNKLDAMNFDWGAKGPDWQRPGHWFMKAGNVYALTRHGEMVTDARKNLKVPLQFITSETDQAVDYTRMKQVFNDSGGFQTNAWYKFPKAEKVPHPMTHWRENPQTESLEKMADVALDFVENGKRTNR